MTIVASIATLHEREESLKDTIESLLPQVDKINVFLHGYDQVPDFLLNDKISLAFEQEFGNYGDLDKFRWVDEVKDCYHLLCDDDLIYPLDYVEKMIEAIDSHNKKAVVSFHGCDLWKFPIVSYYKDRTVYPCLGTVEESRQVDLIGTGVMGYHTDITEILKFDQIEKLFPNMADIHFGIFLKENSIPAFVIEHQKEWIKHSTKVDLNQTIYAKAVNNDFEHTEILDKNRKLFKREKPESLMPLISVIVSNTRGRIAPGYIKQCYDSIRNQSYPNIEPVVIKNYSGLQTIGKAWNDGVKLANGKWILYLGDDDFITEDYIYSMVDTAERHNKNSNIVGVSSFLTMFTDDGETEPRELIPTGMWLREFVLENPFKEYLTKYVDTEFMDRAKSMGKEQIICKWHYGYFYRSHSTQISGRKLMVGAHAEEKGNPKIQQNIQEVVNV